jgi:hypothetical protein
VRFGVEQAAVGQHDTHAGECPVAVLAVPQHMPEALLAAMPPILQALIDAGSGPIFLPNGARRLTSPPMMPGRP